VKIIDAHTHVLPQYAALAAEVMNRCGIDCVVTLEWHDGFGDALKRHLEIFNAHNERFIVFGNIDWGRVNDRDFGEVAAKQIEEGVALGMRGIKIYKSLGLEYRKSTGEFWQINDPAFDPIWAKAGELGIPILIHSADPAAFWQPVDKNNFWNGVLHGQYEWWSYYQKDYPAHEQILADRNDVIARHPRTTFICPHLGSRADCLDRAAADLNTLSNIYCDLSARIPTLGRSEESAERSREFMMKYQDRILFGTDIIYDDTSVPTGIQAQSLYQPGEIPLGDKKAERKYVETTVEFFQSNLDFLTTDKVQSTPPFKRNRRGFSIFGLKLPIEVCKKILYENAKRLILMERTAAG